MIEDVSDVCLSPARCLEPPLLDAVGAAQCQSKGQAHKFALFLELFFLLFFYHGQKKSVQYVGGIFQILNETKV